MPPAKKRKANLDTGGTDDVRPQIMTFTQDQFTINTEQVDVFATPVPRSSFTKDMAQVMEILHVDFYFHLDPGTSMNTERFATLSTAIPANAVTGTLVTFPRVRAAIADPRTLAGVMYTRTIIGPGTGDIVVETGYPLKVDLRDGAGHGVLVATDSLVLVFGGTLQSTTVACTLKIMYRMINIGIMEYIGIVQSQG